ncbi:MAG: efflux transporter outer membrane subunit [Gammaproteobacteria bacterium]|nr:efflux transporter outer membrane subunit [Gammaproteobacteria bacterium]
MSARRLFYLFVFSFTLSACQLGPDFHTPELPLSKTYTSTALPHTTVATLKAKQAGEAQTFEPATDIPQDWWTLYRSPELNRLICRGIKNSPTLAAAKATLRQAEETLNAQIGRSLYPSVTGQFSGTRQNFVPDTLGLSGISTNFNLYNTAVNVSYPLDVFGGQHRLVESVRAQTERQYDETVAAYVTLTANIVTTAIMNASLRAQITATHSLIHAEEENLVIMQKQFALGGVSGTDVLTQQTQVAQTRALLPPLEKNLTLSYDALSVLVGSFPANSDLPQLTLNELHLPKKLPVSLPSYLVKQRPDIRAAEATLHQACAQVGVATANLYPQITLTASYGWFSPSTQDLFSSSYKSWNYAGQITQAIFNGGALRAQKRAAVAALEAAEAQYKKTVLQAFQNVADTLRAIETDAQALQAQQLAETAAQETLKIVQKQYHLGGANYLAVLTAEQQYQQTRIKVIQASAARYADTAALFQALGGGWWHEATQK